MSKHEVIAAAVPFALFFDDSRDPMQVFAELIESGQVSAYDALTAMYHSTLDYAAQNSIMPDEIAEQLEEVERVKKLVSDNATVIYGSMVACGKKVPAIKLYRGLTGVGLKEAKDFVEDCDVLLKNNDRDNGWNAQEDYQDRVREEMSDVR